MMDEESRVVTTQPHNICSALHQNSFIFLFTYATLKLTRHSECSSVNLPLLVALGHCSLGQRRVFLGCTLTLNMLMKCFFGVRWHQKREDDFHLRETLFIVFLLTFEKKKDPRAYYPETTAY